MWLGIDHHTQLTEQQGRPLVVSTGEPLVGLMGQAPPRSSFKRDVARIDVNHEHSVCLKRPEDGLNLAPVSTELFLFFLEPICKHFVRKIRRAVQVSTGEVEDERARYHGHFDDQEFVVVAQHFRDIASTNRPYAVLHEAKVRISLSAIIWLLAMRFDSGS